MTEGLNGYKKVIERIKISAEKVNRTPEEIKLVVVTKTRAADEILKIFNEGHRVFAENRIQEAQSKIPLLPPDIEWHLVGHLQTNKAKQALKLFKTIQSVDSLKLGLILEKEAEKLNRAVECLIEVKISGEESKFGVSPEKCEELILSLSTLKHLQIRGLMGMAPLTSDINLIRDSFKKLKKLFDEIKAHKIPDVDMRWLSMGMSSDFEIAIEEGANMLRIGSAIFEN